MKFFKTICICSSLLLFSCNNEKSTKTDDDALELRREQLREAQAEKAAGEAAELQRIADKAVEEFEAKERKLKEQEMKLAEETRLEEEKVEQERLRQEEIIKQLRSKQKIARDKFIGTKYDSLSVKGKEYTDLKVTRTTDTYVSFLHSSGVSNIKYTDLSEEIREACIYDVRTIVKSKPVQRPIVAKKTAPAAKTKTSTARKSPSRMATTPKPKITPEKVKAVRSSGRVQTRVTRTYRVPYLYRGRKAWNHFKELSITARANVDAVLYLNGSRVMSIPPNVTKTYSGTSLRQGKYTIELRDTKGKVLDRESNSRKSGL